MNEINSISQAKVVSKEDFMHRVFGWMALGLAITAFTSFLVASTPSLISIVLGSQLVFFALIIIELLAVIYLVARVQKMSPSQAGMVFVLYSVLNGLTLSVIFLAYTMSSIASVFVVTAGMFAVVSAYGFITKKDLTSVGSFAFMALIGLILAGLVNLFLNNDRFSFVISCFGVVIFTALTAYDSQKIKNINATAVMGSDTEKKQAVLGALTLYLDFVNLFLYLLRILGGRRR